MADDAASLYPVQKCTDSRSGSTRDVARPSWLEHATARDRWRRVAALHALERQRGAGGIDGTLPDEGPQCPKHGSERSRLDRRHERRRGGIGGDGVMKSVGSWLEGHAADGSAAGLL